MNRYFIKNSNIVLKEIFNNDENLYILKDLIEKILDLKIIEILQKNLIEENKKGFKVSEINEIANLRVLTESKKKVNIGIQIIDGQYIQEKILIYGALISGMQDHQNNSKESIETRTINIIDTSFFSTSEYLKKIEYLPEKLIFYILELPKFKKIKIESKKDAWISYIKSDNINMIEEAKRKFAIINDFDNILDRYWKNEEL